MFHHPTLFEISNFVTSLSQSLSLELGSSELLTEFKNFDELLLSLDKRQPIRKHTLPLGSLCSNANIFTHILCDNLESNYANSLQEILKFLRDAISEKYTDLLGLPIKHVQRVFTSSESVEVICRMLLTVRYEHFPTEGYRCLSEAHPVVYISCDYAINDVRKSLYRLFLPHDALKVIDLDDEQGSISDLSVVLDSIFHNDMAAGFLPLAFFYRAEDCVTGDLRNISKVSDVCRQHKVWLHLEGEALGGLPQGSAVLLDEVKNVDSFTAFSSAHDRSLFFVTYPSTSVFVDSSSMSLRPMMLLWSDIHAVEKRVLAERFLRKFNLVDAMKRGLSENQSIVMKSGIDKFSTSVAFRFSPLIKDSSRPSFGEYCDRLNNWLVETLVTTHSVLAFTIVNVPGLKQCVRFSPCRIDDDDVNESHVNECISALQDHTIILNATLINWEKFHSFVSEERRLRSVELPGWSGIGAVQYVPVQCQVSIEELTESKVKFFHAINVEIAHKLRCQDSAFSQGHVPENSHFACTACTKFGLTAPNTDITDLLNVLLEIGAQVEKDSHYLEDVAEHIKRGIEQASKALIEENKEKLLQESVLRQIPVVGPMLNWWSPNAVENLKLKGRSFDLRTGKVISTENSYRQQALECAEESFAIEVSDAEKPHSPEDTERELSSDVQAE